jgi:hypothetical protein
LNVLGFLKRNNDLVPYMIEGTVDTSVIVEWVVYLQHAGKYKRPAWRPS